MKTGSRFGFLTKRIVDKLTMKTGSKFGHLMKLNCDKRLHLVSRFLYSDITDMTNATKNILFPGCFIMGEGLRPWGTYRSPTGYKYLILVTYKYLSR